MLCNNNYLADILRVCEIKDLIWVMRFQSPLVYIDTFKLPGTYTKQKSVCFFVDTCRFALGRHCFCDMAFETHSSRAIV